MGIDSDTTVSNRFKRGKYIHVEASMLNQYGAVRSSQAAALKHNYHIYLLTVQKYPYNYSNFRNAKKASGSSHALHMTCFYHE